MWLQKTREVLNSRITEIDVSLNDKMMIYSDLYNNVVMLEAKSLTPSSIICNYYKQVKRSNRCVDCFEPQQFLQSTSACDGTSNDGKNRFVDINFSFITTLKRAGTKKKRYSIKFQALNYFSTGTGKDFSDYDLENNIKIEPPAGYTVAIFDFQKDNVTHSG